MDSVASIAVHCISEDTLRHDRRNLRLLQTLIQEEDKDAVLTGKLTHHMGFFYIPSLQMGRERKGKMKASISTPRILMK